MEPKKFKGLLRRTVGIPVLALAFLAAILLWEIHSLRSSILWMNHTDHVISADRELAKLSVDMDTDLRGFLDTGRNEFLQPYNEAYQSIESKFAALNQLVSANPDQQARLAAIRSHFDAWRLEAERMVELRRRNVPNAYMEEGGYKGSLQAKQLMDSIRAEHDAFTAAEEQLRTERVRRVSSRSGLVIVTILLAPLVGGALALLTTRQIRELAERFKTLLDISENRAGALQTVLNSITDGLLVLDKSWRYTYVNEQGARILALRMEDIAGRCIWDLFPQAGDTKFYEAYHRAVESGQPVHFEEFYPEPLNKWLDCHCYPSAEGLSVYFHDITERRRAEEESQKSKRLLEIFVEYAPASLAMFDRNMRYVRVSKKWYEDHGLGNVAILGKTHYEVFPGLPEHWKQAHRRGLAGESLSDEEDWVAADGTKRTLRWAIHPWGDSGTESGGIIIFTEDITQRKQTELALLRSEKLASVGRMAAAIAHEINNPLAATTNALFIVMKMHDLPEGARVFLETADAELRRIAHITRQSLGFYRESNAPAPTRVHAVLESAVELLKSRIKAKHAVIEKQWDEELEITAVAGELRQVFSNLLANSLDAIDEKGTITLRVSAGTSFGNGRRCVRVTIADNGRGVAASSRQHIFEPFFTTKGTIGTGLGLWVSKQIIDKHDGTIRMRSVTHGIHRGTVFSVVLPVEPAAEARSKSAGS